MKNLTIRIVFVMVIGLAAGAALSSTVCFAQEKPIQAKPNTPTGIQIQAPTAPDRKAVEVWSPSAFQSKVENLVKRVDALEMENKELKGQLFSMKFLLTGLDKSFASHTHSLRVSVIGLHLKCEASVGDCSAKPMNGGGYLYIPNGTPDPSSRMVTTVPNKP
jgi:hypothetical protein